MNQSTKIFFNTTVLLALGLLSSCDMTDPRAKQAGARNLIGSAIMAQKSIIEEKGTFATNMSDLGMVLENSNKYYSYKISTLPSNLLDESAVVAFIAQPTGSDTKAYISIVSSNENSNDRRGRKSFSMGLACESVAVTNTLPDLSTIITTGNNSYTVKCPKGYVDMNKQDGYSDPYSNP